MAPGAGLLRATKRGARSQTQVRGFLVFTPASEGARLLAAYLAPHSSPGVVFSRHAQGSGALGLPAVGRCPFVDVTLLLHPDSTAQRRPLLCHTM